MHSAHLGSLDVVRAPPLYPEGNHARPHHRHDRCHPAGHSATLLVIEGEISPPFVVEFAQAHEAAGFDMALVGYTSSSAEGFLVAMHAAARTERLSYLIAHRPGFVAPTLFARKVATFDQLTAAASRCTSSPARPTPSRKATATSHPRPSAISGRRNICT